MSRFDAPALHTGFATVVTGSLRDHPSRVALSVLAIALGVALGVAVHIVNHSALAEFDAALRNLSGEADLIVRGPRAGFDEALYPRIAAAPGVRFASPAVEVTAALADRDDTLRIVGLDPFRALQVQSQLAAALAPHIAALFDADSIVLSQAAADQLRVAAGGQVRLHAGSGTLELTVVGILPGSVYAQPLGLMDIAAAQWRWGRLGRLSRADLRLAPGADTMRVLHELEAWLPPGVQVVTAADEADRNAGLSRSYRLNLDMLALVALFTGAFLVFSTQVLAVLRRRTQLALLRVLGVTRGQLVALLVGEGALIGTAGALLGIVFGYALATLALRVLGADLGAGYFRGQLALLSADPLALAGYFALGVIAAVAGSAGPALDAARRTPAQALKPGDEEDSLSHLRRIAPGALLLGAGLALAQAPPVGGLPVFGYAAIASMLVGVITLMPWLTGLLARIGGTPDTAVAQLCLAQLKGSPGRVAISTAAIVASFGLMVAMATMVASFRGSLDAWLTDALPADLYLRAAHGTEAGFLTPAEQRLVAAVPGVARAQFQRTQNLLLAPDRPPATLLARAIDVSAPRAGLPLMGPKRLPESGAPPPAWVSEVFADLYGVHPGARIELPIAGRKTAFSVAGVWRDYTRQNGAVVIDRELYIELTGDRLADGVAIWIAPGAAAASVERALREQLPEATGVELTETRDIRRISLAIFDRTFAVTYALEIVAVAIGLFGVGASFGAQALARRREFGVLRHLGATRGEIAAMLGLEGGAASAVGVAVGLAVGLAISLILIRVINRQSFHWSMELHVPWLALAAGAATLVIAAAATAVWSGRRAMGREAVFAVREDW